MCYNFSLAVGGEQVANIRDYERLSRILNLSDLLYLEELIPKDDKEHEELRNLIVRAHRWRHQYGKCDHSEK